MRGVNAYQLPQDRRIYEGNTDGECVMFRENLFISQGWAPPTVCRKRPGLLKEKHRTR
jgi:hypothetical protein